MVLTFAQLLSISSVTVSANSNEKSAKQAEAILPSESISLNNGISVENPIPMPEHELKPIVSSEKFTTDEQIVLRFDYTDVMDYYYVADGITVTEESGNSMQFTLTATEEFGSVDVYADYGNGDVVKSSLYTYKYGDTVYVSDIAKDQAWYDCMKDQYESGLITLDEWQDAYSLLSQTFVAYDGIEATASQAHPSTPSSNMAATATSSIMTISGTLSWEINTAGNKLPLRMTKVELHDKDAIGSRCIAVGYTNSYGQYSFTFDNSDDGDIWESGDMDFFIRCSLESETFKVAADWVITSYYCDIDISDKIHNGITTGLDYYILYDEDINASKATYVQQGMVVGQRFAKKMGMSTDNFLNVVFPYTFDNNAAFCFGVLAGNCFSGIGANKFKNIDTLIHEYGHYVERSLGVCGATLWDIIIQDTDHAIDEDQFYDKDDKTFAMHLTWSESWATAFSLIAQDFYKTEYDVLPGFADVKYGNTSYTYETLNVGQNGCEAQEMAVIAVLWDLFDAAPTEPEDPAEPTEPTEPFDNVALGIQSSNTIRCI
ncbi:MAG: hypothetical protein E7453_00320 [Ruminococcaceae bacterium]|nr:hypothetical protein [Oscillospiraceae bacterium]